MDLCVIASKCFILWYCYSIRVRPKRTIYNSRWRRVSHKKTRSLSTQRHRLTFVFTTDLFGNIQKMRIFTHYVYNTDWLLFVLRQPHELYILLWHPPEYASTWLGRNESGLITLLLFFRFVFYSRTFLWNKSRRFFSYCCSLILSRPLGMGWLQITRRARPLSYPDAIFQTSSHHRLTCCSLPAPFRSLSV